MALIDSREVYVLKDRVAALEARVLALEASRTVISGDVPQTDGIGPGVIINSGAVEPETQG